VATGIALALAASLALNVGYLLQHSGLVEVPPITLRRPAATLRGLIASRAWVGGLVIGTAGWALHVCALSKAPISVVQAFVAGGLALALPIGRWIFRQSLSATEIRGIVVLAAGLAALAVGIHDQGVHGSFSTMRLTLFLVASLAAASLLATPAVSARRPAYALGIAGGTLYAAADVAIKALTGLTSAHGLWSALLSPWTVAAVVTTLGAAYCFQRGLQIGSALTVIALMTAATNGVSIVAGFVVFGDPLGSTPTLVALHLGALVVIVGAASRLAPVQAQPPVATAAA
jgi:multidrug transporter EmrE-like cation transporter